MANTSVETWAVTADRVFDGQRALEGAAVLIGGGRVLDVLPLGELPAGIALRDEPGCTLLPGLIDTHVHFMRWAGPLCLAWGVTTVRDCGSHPGWILARRAEAQSRNWPRILCLGAFIDGPEPVHPLNAIACASEDEAVAAVERQAAAGVDGIKLYVGLPNAWLGAIVRAAHRLGLRVSVHRSQGGVLAAARAGADECYHLDGVLDDCWPEGPPGWLERWGAPDIASALPALRRAADELAALGTVVTPTLSYYEARARGHSGELRADPLWDFIPPEITATQAPVAANPAAGLAWHYALGGAQRYCGLLREAGVPILAGTDIPCGAQAPGAALWRELALLQGSGMTPLQALRAATGAAADFLGRPALGYLRRGAAADLVCVRGNPLEHIQAEPAIVWTVRGGNLLAPAALLAEARRVRHDLADEPWQKQFAWHASKQDAEA